MSIPCITNDIEGFKKPCLQSGHLSTCDGFKRSGEECAKCLPAPAENGLLCWSCWSRLELAMNRWPAFAATIIKVRQVMSKDNMGIRTGSSGYIPLAKTVLDVDEVERHLGSYTKVGADLERWVTTFPGAEDAIRFTRLAETAFEAHPLVEKPHRIQKVRCPKCLQISLDWYPPANEEKQVSIPCQNAECRTVFTQDEYEQMELSA
jgi:hypothetical protein